MIPAEPPEISIAWSKVTLRGEKSLREASWALHCILICRGIAMLVRPCALAYAVSKIAVWLSAFGHIGG
jgi:hypothetical protein